MFQEKYCFKDGWMNKIKEFCLSLRSDNKTATTIVLITLGKKIRLVENMKWEDL